MAAVLTEITTTKRYVRIPEVANLRGVALWTTAMLGAGVGYLNVGYDAGIVNVFAANPAFFILFPRLKANSTLLGFNWALFTLGMTLGAFGNTFIGTRWGRRDAIIVASVGMTAFSILQAAAHNLAELMSARLLTGISAGIILGSAPAYISEISPTAARVPLVMIDGIQSVGLSVAFWVSIPFGRVASEAGWRWPAAIQVILSGISTILYFFAPESPRYLAEIGQPDEALRVLRNIQSSEAEAQAFLADIVGAIKLEKTTHVKGFKALFVANNNCWRHRTILVLLLNFSTQACGVGIATYYAGTLLESVGLEGETVHVGLGGLGTASAVFTILGAFSALRFGRIRVMVVCCTCCSLGYTFIAIATANIGTSWGPGLGAFGLYFFLCMWSFGFLPVQYAYPAEIAPLETRMQLVSLGQATQCLINFLVIMCSPIGFERIGWRYMLPYIICSAGCAVMYALVFPETCGLPLEHINLLFQDGKVRMRRSTKDMLDIQISALPQVANPATAGGDKVGSVGKIDSETEFIA